MQQNKPLTLGAVSLLIISVISWGFAFPIIKISLEYVPPLVIGYFRYFFASLPFLAFIFFKFKIVDIKNELMSNWKVLVALGITMVTIPNMAQNIGLLYTTSSIAALIGTVAPVFTVIIAVIVLKESHNWHKVLGFIIAVTASILMVIYTGIEVSDATLFGNFLIFITSVSYGISGIFSKIALMRTSPYYVTGFGMLFGSIILIPISVLFNEPLDWFVGLSITGWILLILLTLLPCMIATFFWYIVLRTYEVSKQVMFTYLIPLFAAVFAYFLLGETLSMITIFLGIIIVLGISLAEGIIGKKNNNKSV
jgi:drug/metabolite transporter (DMT)-like permease